MDVISYTPTTSGTEQPYPATAFNTANTLYLISTDIHFAAPIQTIDVGANSILKFIGGSITFESIKEGIINANNTEIVAEGYPVFHNCSFHGSLVNSRINALWFGEPNSVSGIVDYSSVINRALSSSNGSIVELDNRDYHLLNPININKNGQKLDCHGTLIVDENHFVSPTKAGIEVTAGDVDLHINSIVSTAEEIGKSSATAITISDCCFNSDFNIHKIHTFSKGISLEPRKNRYANNKGELYSGIQYCKFHFQKIHATNCIHFDINTDDSEHIWINENQFFGGYLSGEYGLFVAKGSNSQDFDYLNGNVFNCIGFEGLNYPIYLSHCAFCSFHDLRMSESIQHTPYIDLEDCRYMRFDIKSHFFMNNLRCTNCDSIELKRTITKKDYESPQHLDRIVVNNNRSSANKDFALVSNNLVPNNSFTHHYYGIIGDEGAPRKMFETLNFNELFVKYTQDNSIITLSNLCYMCIYDQVCVTIEMSDSICYLHPELLIRLEIGGNNSKLRFTFNGDTSANNGITFLGCDKNDTQNRYLNTPGLYKISYKSNNSVFIIKLA